MTLMKIKTKYMNPKFGEVCKYCGAKTENLKEHKLIIRGVDYE